MRMLAVLAMLALAGPLAAQCPGTATSSFQSSSFQQMTGGQPWLVPAAPPAFPSPAFAPPLFLGSPLNAAFLPRFGFAPRGFSSGFGPGVRFAPFVRGGFRGRFGFGF